MKQQKAKRCILLLFFLAVSHCFMATAQNNCARQPGFVNALQFDLNRSGFSTSDKHNRGIIFAEFRDPANPVEYTRIYQHPSWKEAGYLGAIVFDEEGNIYVAPLPVVNNLYNPVSGKNTIYKIDHLTGVMEKFAALPVESAYYPHNPFGITGLTYDCSTRTLYVSTLESSDEKTENGKIFSISIVDKKIKTVLEHTDVLGMVTFTAGESKKLFFGSARSSKIYSLDISANASLRALPELAIDFSGYGPRGDDKARKIKFSTLNVMIIYGVEFDYNLVAPTDRQETIYRFQLDAGVKKWKAIKQP